MASHLLNHSAKVRNVSKLLHHERYMLARWFSGDAQSSLNRRRASISLTVEIVLERLEVILAYSGVWEPFECLVKLPESSTRSSVFEPVVDFTVSFTKRNVSMASIRRGSITGSGFTGEISPCCQGDAMRQPQGNIARWLKKEGDKVSPGEVLCEVETDKATVEMESMEEGYLAKIVRGDGEKEIKVGEVIAITVEDEGDIDKFKDYKPSTSEPSAPPVKETSVPSPAKKEAEEPVREPEAKVSKPSVPTPSGDRVFASPLARKLAEEKNVPLSSIKGTGHEGLIVKADIEDFLASSQVSAPSKAKGAADAALDYINIPVSQIRKVTASRLLLSKQTIPHYYLSVDACVDKLMSLRSKLNSLQEASGGSRISVNDLVIKAAALALRKVPQCNSSWANDYIRQYNNGGTFTVSNLGGPFGVKQFCAIINPPQSGILAVGSAERRVIPGSGAEEFKFGSFMSVTLSCDHRVIDGAIGAEWLKAFKGYIENPESMLL
ncbi:Dihydrolipoyllysine-residue acetyltransferase component 3 of pyruvate dehydrogenase [Vigna angularis]|uniref:Dihydrolipoamide acetyltransferase component of pyruvate dehydrogenase complex n=1 Tax=Phaseolus angularis TaxID=3914 RepID=A0A8T0JHS1_PHAAN|nr:Dihydrolipoyllysine-residue acetyltransferase component 3 of pyruvate dehydrogenase [Vigna angularis]